MLLPYIIVNKDYHQRLTVLGLLFACWRIGLNSDGGGMVNMFAEISDLHCKHKILNARCLYRAYWVWYTQFQYAQQHKSTQNVLKV